MIDHLRSSSDVSDSEEYNNFPNIRAYNNIRDIIEISFQRWEINGGFDKHIGQ